MKDVKCKRAGMPGWLYCIAATLFLFGCAATREADMIVHHGVVYMVNERFDTAQAFAVKDGKFLAVGSNEDILRKYTSKETIDAKGRAVYPGLIDAHAHFLGYGQ